MIVCRRWLPAGLVAVSLCAVLAVAACSEPEPAVVSEAEIARARDAIAPFKTQYIELLMAALEEGEAEDAIDICRWRAPEIADDQKTPYVSMGRTSHRVRNTQNAPKAWMEPLLTSYLENPGDTTHRAVFLEDGNIGYAEPIYVQGLCLNCHGSDLEQGVANRVSMLYPNDQATGFEEGDFRGMFWVVMQALEPAD